MWKNNWLIYINSFNLVILFFRLKVMGLYENLEFKSFSWWDYDNKNISNPKLSVVESRRYLIIIKLFREQLVKYVRSNETDKAVPRDITLDDFYKKIMSNVSKKNPNWIFLEKSLKNQGYNNHSIETIFEMCLGNTNYRLPVISDENEDVKYQVKTILIPSRTFSLLISPFEEMTRREDMKKIQDAKKWDEQEKMVALIKTVISFHDTTLLDILNSFLWKSEFNNQALRHIYILLQKRFTSEKNIETLEKFYKKKYPDFKILTKD